jgi:predicted metal-dependent hydrolase
MHIEVVRSTRRRKTVELKPTEDGVIISIPATATKAEEERYVQTLLSRYHRRKEMAAIDLTERAAGLARRYGLRTPVNIDWVENQTTRWGSCTPGAGTIRISSAVAKFPLWVIDYVIIHELAHLSVHGHGPAFWALVEAYPRTERARGFLIAKGLEDGEG